jgi:hypothetical protein
MARNIFRYDIFNKISVQCKAQPDFINDYARSAISFVTNPMEPSTGPYPEPDESSPYPPILFLSDPF